MADRPTIGRVVLTMGLVLVLVPVWLLSEVLASVGERPGTEPMWYPPRW